MSPANPHAQGCVAIFTSRKYLIDRPRSSSYPRNPQTLGEHIRRVKMDRNLLQRDVARSIGANEWTIHNWETNANKPEIRFYPEIMNWLGYCPVVYVHPLGDRLRLNRHYRGVSATNLAQQVGIDPSTLLAWETGRTIPLIKKRSRKKVRLILSLPHPLSCGLD